MIITPRIIALVVSDKLDRLHVAGNGRQIERHLGGNMDYKRYPANWREISRAIRKRELNMCKFCGVPNGAVGWRLPNGNFHEYQPGTGQNGL